MVQMSISCVAGALRQQNTSPNQDVLTAVLNGRAVHFSDNGPVLCSTYLYMKCIGKTGAGSVHLLVPCHTIGHCPLGWIPRRTKESQYRPPFPRMWWVGSSTPQQSRATTNRKRQRRNREMMLSSTASSSSSSSLSSKASSSTTISSSRSLGSGTYSKDQQQVFLLETVGLPPQRLQQRPVVTVVTSNPGQTNQHHENFVKISGLHTEHVQKHLQIILKNNSPAGGSDVDMDDLPGSMTESSSSSPTSSICSLTDDDADCSSSDEFGEEEADNCSLQNTAMEVEFTQPDIYGQVHPIESDALIATKLQEFSVQLKNLCPRQMTNVLAAEQQCPDLVSSNFLLLFLRCECFDAEVRLRHRPRPRSFVHRPMVHTHS